MSSRAALPRRGLGKRSRAPTGIITRQASPFDIVSAAWPGMRSRLQAGCSRRRWRRWSWVGQERKLLPITMRAPVEQRAALVEVVVVGDHAVYKVRWHTTWCSGYRPNDWVWTSRGVNAGLAFGRWWFLVGERGAAVRRLVCFALLGSAKAVPRSG